MRSIALITPLASMALVTACKPPPTDADMARDMPEEAPSFASDPLPSPDADGAVWSLSPLSETRLIYGVAKQAPLVALECREADMPAPSIQITRLSPADEGAGALLALVGNGHIGRVSVDAVEVNGESVWQGEALASDLLWEPLLGPRALGVTVPGAGRVEVNPSSAPRLFIEACRNGDDLEIEIPPEMQEIAEEEVD